MREKLLKMARNYLDNVTPEQLKQDLIECGLYTIAPSPCPIYERNGEKNMTRKPTQINFLTKTHYKFTDDNGVIFNEERKHIKKYTKKAIKPMKTYMLYELKVTLEYSPNEVCVKTFHFNGVKRMSYIIEKLDKLIK